MYRKTFKKLLAAALMVTHLSLVSCNDNPSSSKQPQQPTVPPAASMTTDLGLFITPGGTPKTAHATQAGANFINAAVRAAVINAAVVIGLSVPVAVFALAASQTPTLGTDGKYHWQYTATSGGNTFTADLAGSVDLRSQESVWEMRISSSNPPLNNFLWYDGRAKLDNSSGYWDFYDPSQPSSSVKTIHLDWTYASNTNASLAFAVVKEGVPEKGDELEYEVSGNIITITYEDASPQQTLVISWDRVLHPGYLIAPDYNNGAKACWDANLNDVACQ